MVWNMDDEDKDGGALLRVPLRPDTVHYC